MIPILFWIEYLIYSKPDTILYKANYVLRLVAALRERLLKHS